MAFELLPAIDVSGGRLTRFTSAGSEPAGDFGGDPLEAARAYVAAGARWAHVVDLDLAFAGEIGNEAVVEAVSGLGLRVQASGGVRTTHEVAALLEAGASRVVLSSGALEHERSVRQLVERFAGSVLVGVEADGDRIRSRGRDPVDLPLLPTLGWLTAIGASAFLVTAVERVGELAGPDTALIRRVSRTGRPVLAAGGIATVDDLRAVRAAGAVGAVVGRAAMEGTLDLGSAIRDLAG